MLQRLRWHVLFMTEELVHLPRTFSWLVTAGKVQGQLPITRTFNYRRCRTKIGLRGRKILGSGNKKCTRDIVLRLRRQFRRERTAHLEQLSGMIGGLSRLPGPRSGVFKRRTPCSNVTVQHGPGYWAGEELVYLSLASVLPDADRLKLSKNYLYNLMPE
jgi:hypothetical protein